MAVSLKARLPLAWFGLSAVTLVAWWIGAQHGAGPVRPDAAVAAAAIGIAIIKVRVILREFMEVRHAPALLRHLSDAWLVSFLVAMTAAYLL